MSASKQKIILDVVLNDACQLCKNKTERKQFEEDDHCGEVLSVVDGFPVRCVGEWAYDKIYRLVQYFGIFAQGMHNKWGINYIEICSGPGRCILRERGEEINGTALAILKDSRFNFVNQALFIDRGSKVVAALNDRISKIGFGHKAKAVIGDYTDQDALLVELEKLKPNCLNLVFIDPTECNVPFETIRAIATHLKNVDFIINVAGGTDVTRNLIPSILDVAFKKARAKYESFLGCVKFFEQAEVRNAAKHKRLPVLRKLFAEQYKKELEGLGYCYTDARPVRHYYYLLFASRSPKGLEFWQKACTYSPDGQKEFILE
jgi:three-Cys-motif partner protein